jgi:periplasmic divalent cation tolerance protein
MTDFIQVTVAIDSKEGAQKIVESAVSKRLASSGQVSGPVTSTYWWQGKTRIVEQWVCIFKTRSALYADIEQDIRENHYYDVPGIIATSILTGSQNYLDWIADETQHD